MFSPFRMDVDLTHNKDMQNKEYIKKQKPLFANTTRNSVAGNITLRLYLVTKTTSTHVMPPSYVRWSVRGFSRRIDLFVFFKKNLRLFSLCNTYTTAKFYACSE